MTLRHVVTATKMLTGDALRFAQRLSLAEMDHQVGRSVRQAFLVDRGPEYSWERGRDSTVGGPNHVVSAAVSPDSVRSPTQATYPSGRINTAVGGVTVPTTGISHVPTYLASIN